MTIPSSSIKILSLGTVSFQEARFLQQSLNESLKASEIQPHLLLCNHPPVITLGTGGKRENLLVDTETLHNLGIAFYHIERGGDITYHCQGQLIAYPILNLSEKKKDVAWYMRSLEEVVIKTLESFKVNAVRIQGKTGVWLLNPERKICSIGVKISRWCTYHGIALNISNCSDGFRLIHPCGYAGLCVTSMEEELSSPIDTNLLQKEFIKHFLEIFRYEEFHEL
jgi:lipoyl(octanoyl) transferase